MTNTERLQAIKDLLRRRQAQPTTFASSAASEMAWLIARVEELEKRQD